MRKHNTLFSLSNSNKMNVKEEGAGRTNTFFHLTAILNKLYAGLSFLSQLRLCSASNFRLLLLSLLKLKTQCMPLGWLFLNLAVSWCHLHMSFCFNPQSSNISANTHLIPAPHVTIFSGNTPSFRETILANQTLV